MLILSTLFFILQDSSSVQSKPECGLHCGYHSGVPDGGPIWHWLQPGVHWGGQCLVPDQVVAGCHSLYSGVRLHTSTDIQSLLHNQERQSGSKQRQDQGTHTWYTIVVRKWVLVSHSLYSDHSGMAPFPSNWSASFNWHPVSIVCNCYPISHLEECTSAATLWCKCARWMALHLDL